MSEYAMSQVPGGPTRRPDSQCRTPAMTAIEDVSLDSPRRLSGAGARCPLRPSRAAQRRRGWPRSRSRSLPSEGPAAVAATVEQQAVARASLPFEDKRDFEESKRGFIAAPAYREIKTTDGVPSPGTFGATTSSTRGRTSTASTRRCSGRPCSTCAVRPVRSRARPDLAGPRLRHFEHQLRHAATRAGSSSTRSSRRKRPLRRSRSPTRNSARVRSWRSSIRTRTSTISAACAASSTRPTSKAGKVQVIAPGRLHGSGRRGERLRRQRDGPSRDVPVRPAAAAAARSATSTRPSASGPPPGTTGLIAPTRHRSQGHRGNRRRRRDAWCSRTRRAPKRRPR